MSNVLADLKRAVSIESKESTEQPIHSDPSLASIPNVSRQYSAQPTTVKPSGKVAQSRSLTHQQESPKQILNNKKSHVKQALPQCRDVLPSMRHDSEQSNEYPSQLLNNASLKMKYPQDEPMTPERTSPVMSQSDPLVTQKNSQPKAVSVQASTTDIPTKDIMPPSRLGRHGRARSKNLAQSTETSNIQSITAATNTVSKEVLAVKQEKEAVQRASPSPAPTNISARAAARDRYARHKKMMHQRSTAS